MRFSPLIAAASLLVVPAMGFGDVINGDVFDQFVGGPSTSGPQDGTGTSVSNLGGVTLKVGRVSGAGIDNTNGGRNAVYVFQLPDLGAIADPFTAASLSFGVQNIDGNTIRNADLYGLARRDAAPSILVGDYYFGNAADTTDATLLQSDILVKPAAAPEDPAGTPANTIVATSATGSANLLTFLNLQYGSGAGVGQYVYLRLNVDGQMSSTSGYNVHTANDPAPEKRPTVTYSTSVAADDADFDGDGDVDGADFLTWQRNVATTEATLAQGDSNNDQVVDDEDLAAWKAQFGAATAAAQSVPEPEAIGLTLLAAAAWPVVGRAKDRKNKLETAGARS